MTIIIVKKCSRMNIKPTLQLFKSTHFSIHFSTHGKEKWFSKLFGLPHPCLAGFIISTHWDLSTCPKGVNTQTLDATGTDIWSQTERRSSSNRYMSTYTLKHFKTASRIKTNGSGEGHHCQI